MSIFGTLALMITSLAARPKTPDVEITVLKTQIDHLTRERDQARIEADRWRLLAESWRQRYEIMNDAAAAINLYQQRLGAQHLSPELYCNCVPPRHDLILQKA